MRNALKWIAIVFGSLVVLAGLALAYLAATFDPNDYKPTIVKAVEEKTGRKLDVKGDIKLSYFPSLGVRVGHASLSERNRAAEFASFEEAFVSVKLLPLIAKQVIVDAVEVKGIKARIERNKAGEFNFADLKAGETKEDQPAQFNVDIDHVTVTDGEIVYVDRAGGSEYRLSGVSLKTGRIAAGATTPIDLSATLAAPNRKAHAEVALKTRLTVDPQREIYKLEGLDFSSKGELENLSAMHALAKGRLEARLATNEFLVSGLQVDLSGKGAGGDMRLRMDAPKLTLTKDKVEGGRIALDASMSEPKSKLVLKASVPGVQGSFNAFRTEPIAADIEMQRDGRTTTARLSGTLSGDLEATRFEVPDLALTAKIADAKLAKDAFEAALAGSARVDIAKETAALEVSGKLDESSVNGKADLSAFSPLGVKFAVKADRLDIDKLLGRKAGGASGSADPKPPASKDEKIDLSILEDVNAGGALEIGSLTAMNLQAEQVRMNLKVADGRLDVSPIAAQLYQGTLKGSLSARAAGNAVFAVKQTLSGVAVGPLLRDAARIDTLEGRGTVTVDLSTEGSTLDAMKRALDGTASVSLRDGSIKGMDILAAIRGARASLDQLRGRPVQESSNMAQKTDFAELKATFKIRDGVAHNNDLSFKSPLLRASGAGEIDIANDRLDYVLKASVVATSKGQGGRSAADLRGVTVPVKLTGALDAPQWAVDFTGLATGLAKDAIQNEILNRAVGGGEPGAAGKKESGKPSSVEDTVRDRLKGIFGR
jgi:AsmA protein